MPNNKDADAIKSVMKNSLIQQVLALFKFGGTEALALQVPDTDILILAGPKSRIQGYLSTPIPYGAAGGGLRDNTLEEAAQLCDQAALSMRDKGHGLEAWAAGSLAKQIRDKKGLQ